MAEEPKILHSLLVEKTGKSEEEALLFLQELKQKIEDAVEAGESFTIDGFGAFTGENGLLRFEPSGRLETEINQKYAGMQPIELVEAFKETGADEPLEPIEPKSSEEPEPEALSEPVADFAEPGTDEVEEQDGSHPEEKEEAFAEEPDQPAREEESAEPGESKTHPLPSRRKNRNGAWIAAASVLIVVILVLLWLFFSNRIFPGKGNSDITASQPVDTAKAADLPMQQKNDSTKVQLQTSATPKNSNKKAALTPSSTITYGLHGKVNPQIEGAYTIVIHSFQQKSTVQGIAKKLLQKGYRAVIFSGNSKSDIHWRVGLGQFKTIEAAQEAVKKLPERYQKAHFIHRINN